MEGPLPDRLSGQSGMTAMGRIDKPDSPAPMNSALTRDAAGDRGELFAEALENVSEAIVIYDGDGCLVACNRNFRELYGYTAEEAAPGVHFAALGRIDVERGNVVVGDAFGDGENYLKRKAEYRNSLTGSFIVHLKDGRWIKTTDRPMSRGGFVSVQVDVTDIKHSEQELMRAKEEAETASRQKSEFLANISHDLRTPLNSVIGFSELILGETWGELGHDKYRDYAESIRFSGQLLLSLVSDILDTARLESGTFPLNPAPMELPALCERVVRSFDPLTRRKRLNLSIENGGGLPARIAADERALTQVLNNLVSNAAKHAPEGGEIGIRIGGRDGRAVLEIWDNGPGMPAALARRIGEPFLRDDAYVAGIDPGTGLGLYICARLAEAMNGELAVSDRPGGGARFTFSWPAESA